jgi:hypothetical protein
MPDASVAKPSHDEQTQAKPLQGKRGHTRTQETLPTRATAQAKPSKAKLSHLSAWAPLFELGIYNAMSSSLWVVHAQLMYSCSLTGSGAPIVSTSVGWLETETYRDTVNDVIRTHINRVCSETSTKDII